MIGGRLTVWTIHDRPADYPDKLVVTLDVIAGPDPHRVPARWFARSIAEARRIIQINDPTADHRHPRDFDDDPTIVECWY